MKASEWLNSKTELKCSKCGRISVAHEKGDEDKMPQPNGSKCGGVFL